MHASLMLPIGSLRSVHSVSSTSPATVISRSVDPVDLLRGLIPGLANYPPLSLALAKRHLDGRRASRAEQIRVSLSLLCAAKLTGGRRVAARWQCWGLALSLRGLVTALHRRGGWAGWVPVCEPNSTRRLKSMLESKRQPFCSPIKTLHWDQGDIQLI